MVITFFFILDLHNLIVIHVCNMNKTKVSLKRHTAKTLTWRVYMYLKLQVTVLGL